MGKDLKGKELGKGISQESTNYHFELGKGEQLTEGNDTAIIATGLMVNEARMAAEQLAAEGIHLYSRYERRQGRRAGHARRAAREERILYEALQQPVCAVKYMQKKA